MIIELTWDEVDRAWFEGCVRARNYRMSGRAHACNFERMDSPEVRAWGNNIEGALGELAVAKATGRYWSGVTERGAFDVDGLQVRTSQPNGRLIIHEWDPDDHQFIHVRAVTTKPGKPLQYDVRGWIYAREGKRREWWEDPTGRGRWSFYVPDASLHALADLGLSRTHDEPAPDDGPNLARPLPLLNFKG